MLMVEIGVVSRGAGDSGNGGGRGSPTLQQAGRLRHADAGKINVGDGGCGCGGDVGWLGLGAGGDGSRRGGGEGERVVGWG